MRYGKRLILPLIAVGMVVCFAGGGAAACEGALAQVQIDPVEPGRTDVFTGKGRTVEIRFTSDTGQADPDVFPEPPLVVRNLASGAECKINGGIWVRRSVWLTADERGVVVEEYSGSNDRLAVYDTASCKELSALDVSEARWQVADGQLTTGKTCTGEAVGTCKETQRQVLGKACAFEKSPK
jgi:hypothetical protein